MRVVLIGGVSSTLTALHGLKRNGFSEVLVLGYVPVDPRKVSGWSDLSEVALASGYKFLSFSRVNECVETIREFRPDVVFVVGLSQLVGSSIIEIPRLGCVGFHPTALPIGRGRAPIAWLVLNKIAGAATFFGIRDGVDDGPIYAQENFDVDSLDDALSVERKILVAEAVLLDRWLPELKSLGLNGVEQDHTLATYHGFRGPDDGLINWDESAELVDRKIKASTRPHPGAFTYAGNVRVFLWSAEVQRRSSYSGVVGRILNVWNGCRFEIQCGTETLLIKEWGSDSDWIPRVGAKLGYFVDTELFELKKNYANLLMRIEKLEQRDAKIVN